MKRKAWAYSAISLLILGGLWVAGGFAGNVVPDVLQQFKGSYERTKNNIDFTHEKHITEHEITCGECHHDDKGQPLTDLKRGDEVQTCFECHSKPGEAKGKEAKGMSKEEKRAFHAEAVHDNCIDCHRQYNREHKKKLAPQTCTDCHPK